MIGEVQPKPFIDLTLKQPYPLRPQSTLRKKPVTIAAGFKCGDGILLATDLEITDSSIKRIGGKSTYFRTPEGALIAIAGAGYYDILAYACETMAADVTGNSIREIIEDVRRNLTDLYDEHVRPSYPQLYEQAEALKLIVAVIVGTQESIEDYRLYVSEQTVIREAEPYQFVGIGKDLAYYIMRNVNRRRHFYRTKQDLRADDTIETIIQFPLLNDVVPIAKRIISEVGKNVVSCGRQAKILKVPNTGEEPVYLP